ncbi:MAG: T9SS type A sorting domain-containing protein, partial [Chitinophagales bacterium]|nr:T9SS type A sorting domain-containing protein [Chitinophagales bacterium]
SGTAWQRGSSLIAAKSGTVSGTNAWVTDMTAVNYSNFTESYLYTPCFNMSANALDTIQFFLKNAFEISYDGMRVEYSTDLGATWTPLSTAVKTGWYDYANPNNDRPFPQNQAYFNANNTVFNKKLFSISFLTGNKTVAFRFAFKSDNTATAAGAALDNFSISSTAITTPYQHIETALCSKSEYLNPNDSVTFYSPNGKIMAVIKNQTAHNYGLTKVEIDGAGIVPRNYSINTTNQSKISGKTYAVSPAVNDTAGAYSAMFFYTNEEIQAWRDTTGYNFNAAKLLKCPNRIDSGLLSNAVYGSSPAFALYNAADSSIAGNFNTGFSGFAFGGSSTLLPVILLEFTGLKMTNYNQLNWITSSEKNNEKFDIERSANGIDFAKIGEVKGNGNSIIQLKYRFEDLKLDDAPIHYYRLKQVDFDGQFEYSKIIAISQKALDQIRVYPNPAKSMIHLDLNGTSGFQYKLYNAGMTLMGQGLSANSSLNLSIEDYPKGCYFVEIERDGVFLERVKFTKE